MAAASTHAAAVAEFRCLFTHDVRRKQKRWQDGFLTFHAFNRRVMVYDEARNFLGDTYCKDREALHEGDTLTLDKGAMVEVAEAVGLTHTDLTPLLGSKTKRAPPRPPPAPTRHRSLSTLLGIPRGPMGKAKPMQSPFETRLASKQTPTPASPSPTVLLDEMTPRAAISTSRPAIPSSKPAVETRSRPVQTPKIPRGKVPVPVVKATETPQQPTPRSSPPVNASNRLADVEYTVQSPQLLLDKAIPPHLPPREPKAKSLRLSAGVKRGTLICQMLPQHVPRTHGEPKVTGVVHESRQASGAICKEISPIVSDEGKSCLRKESSQVPGQSGSLKSKRKAVKSPADDISKRAKTSPAPSELLLDIFDDPEIVHGKLDEPLLLLSSPVLPRGLQEPPPMKHSNFEAASGKKSTNKEEVVMECSISAKVLKNARNTRMLVAGDSRKKTQSYIEVKAEIKAASEATNSTIPALKRPVSISRDVSPTCSEVFNDSPPTPISHRRVLSTGGFNKKKNHTLKSTTKSHIPNLPLPERRDEITTLPSHPLRSKKKGPLMSTTELATFLQQKSSNSNKVANDPIEDDAIGNRESPSRRFRRVRSENDAPILSAADAWEKRNLPKVSITRTNVTGPGIEAQVLLVPSVAAAAAAAAAAAKEGAVKNDNGLSALIKKTDPRRQFKRTRSLAVVTNVPPVVAVEELQSPVIDDDVGPWSTEAGDLFDWRPPGRA